MGVSELRSESLLEHELHEARKRAREANIRADKAELKLRTYKAKVRKEANGGWIAVEWEE